MHEHITKEVEKVGQSHRPEAHPVFAATLNDGTFLPCVRASPKEGHVFWVKPDSKEPYLQFDAKALGLEAYANCIIHGDYVRSVQPSPYFLPQAIFDKLCAARYRDEYFALRLQMKNNSSFTLMGGSGMSCYKAPEGYLWDDVIEFGSDYDHNPINPIYPMIEFHCVLWGLSYAKITGA